jgi:hypothetical protein
MEGLINYGYLIKLRRDDLPMAVVDYKKCFEFNGTIPENSILKPG